MYFTRGEGTIFRYRYDRDAVRAGGGRRPQEGLLQANTIRRRPGTWPTTGEQTAYRAVDRLFYGVHGNSGYLFSFDPRERVEVLDRITSAPSRRSGMFDQFSYGYLGFTLRAGRPARCTT